MAQTAFVGEGGRKSKAPRWPFVVGLIVAVVLALAAGVFVRWIVDRNKAEPAPEPLAAEIQEVQDLTLDNKPEEAEKKISELLADPNVSAEVKYSLYLQQGATYYQKGEYQPALDSYTKAFDIRQTYPVAQSIGSTWLALGNKQKAIEYYRKAIELIPQDNPVRDDEVQVIEEQIKALESGS